MKCPNCKTVIDADDFSVKGYCPACKYDLVTPFLTDFYDDNDDLRFWELRKRLISLSDNNDFNEDFNDEWDDDFNEDEDFG